MSKSGDLPETIYCFGGKYNISNFNFIYYLLFIIIISLLYSYLAVRVFLFYKEVKMELLKETLKNIKEKDSNAERAAMQNIDKLAKPIGSLGTLEKIAAKIAGITGNTSNRMTRKNVIVMCADNGVVEEGVSSAPKNTTAILTENLAKNSTGVSVLSEFTCSDLTIVDIGVDAVFDNPLIVNKKIGRGTFNIAKGPAMEYFKAVEAIEAGIEIIDKLSAAGYDMFGTGEMGIGNTTTSAAVLSALSGMPAEIVTGKGAGITEEQFIKKKNIVDLAVHLNSPDPNDPVDVIAKVGGFDIAGLCGCFLGAAKNRKPIVIDGFISSTAALCAVRLNRNVKDYLIPSHLSDEPGARYIMEEIGLEPMLNLHMRLGEGSGCPLAFQIIDSALYITDKMPSFEEASIDNETLVDIR